jgi:PhnB protein
MGTGYSQGNNFSISITADSKEEADKLFNGLSAAVL